MPRARIGMAAIFVTLVPGMAAGAEPPLLLDPGTLRLRVVKTEVRPRVSDAMGTTLSANPGAKLVVVTLRGVAQKPNRVAFEAREFSVLYEEKQPGGKPPVVRIQPSAAIAEGGFWSMLPPRATGAVGTFPVKPGPVTFQFAVVLPRNVESFSIRYPTLAGKATLGKRSVAKHP